MPSRRNHQPYVYFSPSFCPRKCEPQSQPSAFRASGSDCVCLPEPGLTLLLLQPKSLRFSLSAQSALTFLTRISFSRALFSPPLSLSLSKIQPSNPPPSTLFRLPFTIRYHFVCYVMTSSSYDYSSTYIVHNSITLSIQKSQPQLDPILLILILYEYENSTFKDPMTLQ